MHFFFFFLFFFFFFFSSQKRKSQQRPAPGRALLALRSVRCPVSGAYWPPPAAAGRTQM